MFIFFSPVIIYELTHAQSETSKAGNFFLKQEILKEKFKD